MASCSRGSRGQALEWAQVYDEIKKDYEEAYMCIDQAIKLDEEGKVREAAEKYEFGLSIIDKALSLPLECPENPDISWEKAYVMIQKMRKTRKEITIRISNAQSEPDPMAVVPPPSYEEAMALPSVPTASAPVLPPYIPASAIFDNHLTSTETKTTEKENGQPGPSYADLSNQLSDLKMDSTKEILYSHDNVRIYFISPDGRVSAPSDPALLTIARIHDTTASLLQETVASVVKEIKSESERDHKRHHHRHHRRHGGHRHRRRHHNEPEHEETDRALVYLQVGTWLYPLIPGVSPCYRTDFGAYILPDVNSGIEGAAVGLILPQEADESVHQLLNDVLNSIMATTQVDEHPHRPPRTRRSDRTDPVAKGSPFTTNLVRGATYIANNLMRGADSTAKFIDRTTPRIIDKIQPKPEPTQVNPSLRKSVEVAKSVTGTAAGVTDYLATKLGIATSALGRYLAPHVQKQGTRLLTSTTKMSQEEASHKMDSMLDVTSGAVESVATVYGGLQTAAGMLGRSLSNNTVQIIEYKYGQPMGEVTSDAFSTAGNVYSIRNNYKVLKPMGIAKTAAKSAGTAVLEDYKNSKASTPHPEFRGSGPGDGSGFKKEPL